MYLEIIYRASKVDLMLYEQIEYANNNYASNPKHKKLVIRYYFFINRAFVSWCNKKLQIVSTSIIKAKYIALSHRK